MFDTFPASFHSIVNRLRKSFRRFIIRPRRLNLPVQRNDTSLKAFLKAHLYIGATDAQVDSVADKYSQDPAAVRYLPIILKLPLDQLLTGLSIRYRKSQRFNVRLSRARVNVLGLKCVFHRPEFKRLSAIQGDHIFQSGRRAAFSKWAATQNVWSYR